MKDKEWLLVSLSMKLSRDELLRLAMACPSIQPGVEVFTKQELIQELERHRRRHWNKEHEKFIKGPMRARQKAPPVPAKSLCVITAAECNENLRRMPPLTMEYLNGGRDG